MTILQLMGIEGPLRRKVSGFLFQGPPGDPVTRGSQGSATISTPRELLGEKECATMLPDLDYLLIGHVCQDVVPRASILRLCPATSLAARLPTQLAPLKRLDCAWPL